jgi:hypothetical protein
MVHAQAAQPLIVEDVRFDGTPALDEGLTEGCGFPVTVSTEGHFRGTVFFDNAGNFREFTGHPSMVQTFTSPYASIQTSDRGLDKYSLNDDGTLLIFGTGIHLRIDGEVYAIGLWRLTIDLETDELIEQEYHGNYDVLQPEIQTTLCALLGP